MGKFTDLLTFDISIIKKIAANSLALSFLKLYLIIPLINFYFQYLKFNTLFSTNRLCYIFLLFFNPSILFFNLFVIYKLYNYRSSIVVISHFDVSIKKTYGNLGHDDPGG